MRTLFCLLVLTSLAEVVAAQSFKTFPSANVLLTDAKHKEPKSGVQTAGNTITIQSGIGTPTTINVLAFSKDGKLLSAGKDFGRVVVWDIVQKKFLCASDTGQGIVTAVAISPDGASLITSGQGDQFSIKLWHLPDCSFVRSYSGSKGFVHSLTFGTDGKWVIASDNSGAAYAIDIASGKRLVDLKDARAAVLSPDGNLLIALSNGTFASWITSDWQTQGTIPRPTPTAMPLAVNQQTDSLVIASSSGNFQLVRLSTGELLATAPSQPLPKYNAAAGGFAAFDSASPNLLFGHSDGRLWAWDTRTGQTCVSEVLYSESGTLSSDGSILAGSKDNSFFAQSKAPDGVMLWDTKNLATKCGFDAAETH
jgi:WD40 repeat protein